VSLNYSTEKKDEELAAENACNFTNAFKKG